MVSVHASHESDGFHELSLHLTSHMGTHIDAPFHILKNGKSLNDYALDHFTGSAICIKVEDQKMIGLESFISHQERIENHDFLLIQTGWSSKWNAHDYMTEYPALSNALCEWLAQRCLKGLGIDMPSVDPPTSEKLPNHHHLLENDVLIIENLTNLKTLPRSTFEFFVFPLKFERMDGGQVRACARW